MRELILLAKTSHIKNGKIWRPAKAAFSLKEDCHALSRRNPEYFAVLPVFS
jgi:hypothetical protein